MANEELRQNQAKFLGKATVFTLVHICAYPALFQKGFKVALFCSFYGLWSE